MLLYLPNGLLKRVDADLSNLTDSQRVGAARWLRSDELPVVVDGEQRDVDVLLLPLDPPPSPEERVAIRRRLVTADAEDEAMLQVLIAEAHTPDLSVKDQLQYRDLLERYGEKL